MNNQNYTSLDRYSRRKKTLTPPLAQFDIREKSWVEYDLPEMLWAVLAIRTMPREEYLSFFKQVSEFSREYPEIKDITMTGISNSPINDRFRFLKQLFELEEKLIPRLRAMLLFEDMPGFKEWGTAIQLKPEDKDIQCLAAAVHEAYSSQIATDLQWLRLICFKGKRIKFTNNNFEEELKTYPQCNKDHNRTSSFIRTFWNAMRGISPKTDWSFQFWRQCLKYTGCLTRINKDYIRKIQWDKKRLQENILGGKDKLKDADIEDIISNNKLYIIRAELRKHFLNSENIGQGHESKYQVVFAMIFYALDIFATNILYRSALTIVGRINLRIILETYIRLAYMLKEEKNTPKIWFEYKNYGAGRFTSIYKSFRDKTIKPPRLLNASLIELIANEDGWNELRPINYGAWHNKNAKEMSKEIGAEELYNKYYEYLSEYQHAGWGAVRQSSMQICYNLLHKGHIIPTDNMMLQLSNINDCKIIMNKLLKLVDTEYPSFKFRF